MDPEFLASWWIDRAAFRWRSILEGDNDEDDKSGVLGSLGDSISADFKTTSETGREEGAISVVGGSSGGGVEYVAVDDNDDEVIE